MEVEVSTNPLPSRVRRRWLQLKSIGEWAVAQDEQSVLQKRYSETEEVQFYKATAFDGFDGFEQKVLDCEFKKMPRNIAVIGCGGGREVFAFEKMFSKSRVSGFDLSLPMIEAAKTLQPQASEAQFIHGDQLSGKYDLIWISASIESHIRGQKQRVQFYKSLEAHLSPMGKIISMPLIHPMGLWTARVLGSLMVCCLKPLEWEYGDSLRSFWGSHSTSPQVVYCYYYPSPSHFSKEVLLGGLSPRPFDLKEKGVWILQRKKDVFF